MGRLRQLGGSLQSLDSVGGRPDTQFVLGQGRLCRELETAAAAAAAVDVVCYRSLKISRINGTVRRERSAIYIRAFKGKTGVDVDRWRVTFTI